MPLFGAAAYVGVPTMERLREEYDKFNKMISDKVIFICLHVEHGKNIYDNSSI